jgi:hypothetical protein
LRILKALGLLALVAGALGVTWASARYLGPSLSHISSSSKSPTRSQDQVIDVSLLIDFGNGTRLWFNNTTVPDNYNFYNVTYHVANGNLFASWSDLYSSHFVDEILGFGCVPGSAGCGGYWSLWVWDGVNSCWSYSSVGVDWLKVSTVGTIAWYYNNYDFSGFLGRCP